MIPPTDCKPNNFFYSTSQSAQKQIRSIYSKINHLTTSGKPLMFWQWTKRAGIGLAGLLAILAISGGIYQVISTKIDAKKYPPIGKLIDLGGYNMHLYTTGTGGPTVVLDAGMGCNSLSWSLVQPEIAKFTQVTSFDRPGNGWSDESPLERTSQNIITELHTALHKANIPSPYILVGHSFGGVNARLYASKYPEDVAGIILVDSSHENQLQQLPPLKKTLLEKLVFHQKLARVLAFIGIVRIFNHLSTDYEAFSGDIPKMCLALESTPKFIGTIFEENRLFAKSLEQIKNSNHHLGEKPLIVLTAGRICSKGPLNQEYSDIWIEQMRKEWNILQKDLTTKSTRSKQFFAEESDHMIPFNQPKIIIDSVKEMIDCCKKLRLK